MRSGIHPMNVSDFDFELPEAQIAQQPLARRNESRMIVVNRSQAEVRHTFFINFTDFFKAGDVLVFNETRVIPARIWGQKQGRIIEFLFVTPLPEERWEVLCRPARHVRPGDWIEFTPDLRGEVSEVKPEGSRILRFKGMDVLSELKNAGYAPLPPYIKREKEHESLKDSDLERYQTVFARTDGSIAAPTAGLHFTPEILESLRSLDVVLAPVNLEVGLATFQPIRVDRVEDHTMLEERYAISESSASIINDARRDGRTVAAVGTTSVRTLESAAQNGMVVPGVRLTRKFIYPGYRFQIVDRLLTNFHLPRSTLLMLTSAFGGYSLIMEAYREAVRAKYRFFSYGDCMFIL